MDARIVAMTLTAIALGLGFPGLLVYLAAVYNLDLLFVGIMVFLSLLGAVAAPAVIGGLSYDDVSDDTYLRRQNAILRAALADALKEIDEMNENLEKLLNILKEEV